MNVCEVAVGGLDLLASSKKEVHRIIHCRTLAAGLLFVNEFNAETNDRKTQWG